MTCLNSDRLNCIWSTDCVFEYPCLSILFYLLLIQELDRGMMFLFCFIWLQISGMKGCTSASTVSRFTCQLWVSFWWSTRPSPTIKSDSQRFTEEDSSEEDGGGGGGGHVLLYLSHQWLYIESPTANLQLWASLLREMILRQHEFENVLLKDISYSSSVCTEFPVVIPSLAKWYVSKFDAGKPWILWWASQAGLFFRLWRCTSGSTESAVQPSFGKISVRALVKDERRQGESEEEEEELHQEEEEEGMALTNQNTLNIRVGVMERFETSPHRRTSGVHSCRGLGRFGPGCRGFPAGSSNSGSECSGAAGSWRSRCPGLTWAGPCSERAASQTCFLSLFFFTVLVCSSWGWRYIYSLATCSHRQPQMGTHG